MAIGIRAEDKNRWERRAPLTPDHVRELVAEQHVDVAVQPSHRRAFSERDYREAGARVDPDLSGCRVVLGVKEIPLEKLEADRVYVNFPHVAKGQPANMPALRRTLEIGCTMVDYERIVDRRGRRLIAFGRYAGYAGMIDSLWALGQRLAREGFLTPLEHVRPAWQYADLEDALRHVARIGEHIRHLGMPAGLRPIVAAFTGSGNVSQGAQEVFARLPVQEIEVSDIERLGEERSRPRNAVFKTVLGRADRYRRRDGGPFSAPELDRSPELYESALPSLLPHFTLFVHGAYWEPGQPQLIGRADLRALYACEAQPKLRVIGDITCDIGGAVASTVHATDTGSPVYVYDPATGETRDGVEGRGPVVMAVDNLPCELPVDASQHFGDGLVHLVGALERCDWNRPLAELDLPPELHRAVIAHGGELASDLEILREPLRRFGGEA